MKILAPGTQIIYIREDSGISIQNEGETVLLKPGAALTVGADDVSPELATRLVEDGVCRVYSLPQLETVKEQAGTAKEPVEAVEDPAEAVEDPAEEAKPEQAKPENDAHEAVVS